MRFCGVFLLIFALFYSTPAVSEYRVFLLKISKKPKDTDKKPGEQPDGPPKEDFRLITSTLDPEQYRLYYTVYPDEQVSYIDTWRCYGRTDYKDFCVSPRAPAATANPDQTAGQDQISAAPASSP